MRTALMTVLSLGFDRAMRIARAGADLAFRLDKRHRRRALENIERALPALSARERERIARNSFRSFAMCYVELVYAPRIIRAGNLDRHLEMTFTAETRAALGRGRGAIFVTLHLGNWEITGHLVSFFGLHLVSVARPIDNPFLNRYLTRVREMSGQRIVAKRGALRELARALKNGEPLGILADQNAGRHGIFVEFLGRPASTVGAPATLALKYDAPLIPAYQQRLDGYLRHRVVLGPTIEPPGTGERSLDVWLMTQAMTRWFEKGVRETPDQWLWAHRRWKTQPREGEEWRPNPSTSAV